MNIQYGWLIDTTLYKYIYTVKMKVRMPPRIPNIPPPQLECGTRTAKNHSVRMPPRPGFKFFVVSETTADIDQWKRHRRKGRARNNIEEKEEAF